jgi:hypothetical protein
MSEEAELNNPNFTDGARHTRDTTNTNDSTHEGASHPNFITTGSLSCSGWYDSLVTRTHLTQHEFDYVSQDLGFEGIEDFNVVQGVFDNERDMGHSDASALLLSIREERWNQEGSAPIDMSEFEVRAVAGTNVPEDATRAFDSESQSMSGTTLGSAGSPETPTSQTRVRLRPPIL